jgi:hypothetical protein
VPEIEGVAMTEAEWLACTDPAPMLEHLRGTASDRKLRLFGLACVHGWPDRRPLQNAVAVAERFADGRASRSELAAARAEAELFRRQQHYNLSDRHGEGASLMDEAVCEVAGEAVADVIKSIAWCAANRIPIGPAYQQESKNQVRLLRDIIGNPFRPVAVDPAWLSWNAGTVVRLAQAIYDERAFDRLPILADALEETGCHDADILAHCRQPSEHARGCWVVDCLLGKK